MYPGTLRDALRELAYDPGALEEIEGRLFLIEELKRKLAFPLRRSFATETAWKKKNGRCWGAKRLLLNWKSRRKEAVDAFRREALALSACRREAAQRLKTVIEKNLQDKGAWRMPPLRQGLLPCPVKNWGENGSGRHGIFQANRGEGDVDSAKIPKRSMRFLS